MPFVSRIICCGVKYGKFASALTHLALASMRAHSSIPYRSAMTLTKATKHIMMKSWPPAEVPFDHHSRHFSSVCLGVYSSFRPILPSETPQKRSETARETLEERSMHRIPLHIIEVMTDHGNFHGHHACRHVAREQGSCSRGCTCSGPE
jgi:hypothetical protein